MRCLILAYTGTSMQGEHEVPVYLSDVGRVLHWNDINECTVLRRECRVGRAWDHMTDVSRMSPEVFYVWGIITFSRVQNRYCACAQRLFAHTVYR